jgi:hypothetical protein
MDQILMESCHCTWIFDTYRMRFRRVLKGLGVGPPDVATEWRPYHRLDVDRTSRAFTVVLDPRGTRRIRSWQHDEHCVQCGLASTTPPSGGDLLPAANW